MLPHRSPRPPPCTHGDASAHVLAAVSDYSLVKEHTKSGGRKPPRLFRETLASALADALVLSLVPRADAFVISDRVDSFSSSRGREYYRESVACQRVVRKILFRALTRSQSHNSCGNRCIGGGLETPLNDLSRTSSSPQPVGDLHLTLKRDPQVRCGRRLFHPWGCSSRHRSG